MHVQRGILVRLIYLAVAILWWVLTGFGRGYRHAAVVLCYHGVTRAQRERFGWQLHRLRNRVISVNDLDYGRSWNRGPRVCITFDDVFENLWDNVFPILRHDRVPVTVFAVTGNFGRTPTWPMPDTHPDRCEPVARAEALQAAAHAGLCEVGSHTVSHPALATMPSEIASRELLESKAALEKLVSCPVVDLALPYGSFDARIVELTREAGYRHVFTLEPRLYTLGCAAGVIGRFLMSPDAWRLEFELTCAGSYAWLYPWQRFFRFVRTWPPQLRRTGHNPTRATPGQNLLTSIHDA